MKNSLKYLGLLFIILGVATLSYYASQSIINNLYLIIAGGLIIGGLSLYILLNRIID